MAPLVCDFAENVKGACHNNKPAYSKGEKPNVPEEVRALEWPKWCPTQSGLSIFIEKGALDVLFSIFSGKREIRLTCDKNIELGEKLSNS